ncbi:hypothetical protein VNO80_23005 [Phaseolus coccineus]|uniref:Uncharacterized protein n=1 Tax=Phaseolus coccineus TaxID=3886 RepID=A0AAN9M604_PHACN
MWSYDSFKHRLYMNKTATTSVEDEEPNVPPLIDSSGTADGVHQIHKDITSFLVFWRDNFVTGAFCFFHFSLFIYNFVVDAGKSRRSQYMHLISSLR